MSESKSNRAFWGSVVLAVVATLVAFFWPQVAEEFRPEIVGAWIAIETTDGVARSGTSTVAEGEGATLHAVLEAQERGGEILYYTEADRLEVEGVEVAADRLRRWDRSEGLTVLWFTVEGSAPYVEVTGLESIDAWQFATLFRADWPRSWSIPAQVTSRHDAHLPRTEYDRERRFGTQRYHVRLELRDPDRPAFVLERYSSLGADQVLASGESFPTLQATLPEPLSRASGFFGLSQLEPTIIDVEATILEKLVKLSNLRLAFSRATLFRDILAPVGQTFDALSWQVITLDKSELSWGEAVGPGDLVRVGARTTLLYRDLGDPGVLDGEDLCFDFERGARIQPLNAVFSAGGLVEWAPLPIRADSTSAPALEPTTENPGRDQVDIETKSTTN